MEVIKFKQYKKLFLNKCFNFYLINLIFFISLSISALYFTYLKIKIMLI